ncbi:hypothetical protein CKO51_13350 [Rhodopirellula sp. SM50]|nr:serine/threonine-protein kinase [Rhodopirellula sp. SM50]PAY19109.1 hypothetical protein CKO51_13350 [Rhodopirellula sp. SM50]
MNPDAAPDPPTDLRVDRIADAFEAAWKAFQEAGTSERPRKSGDPPDLTTHLADASAEDRQRVAEELIRLDRFYRDQSGLTRDRQWYADLLSDVPRAMAAAFDNENVAELPGDATACAPEVTIDQASAGPSIGSAISPPGQKPRVRYFGDYELLDEIARGGMGVVYRARQISLDRCVALKMILGSDFAGKESEARFQMEAESAARLDHPHIVPIHDIGHHDGLPYFSMKFVDGTTLSAKADELRQDTNSVIELVAKIADAVHHAHQRGIVHRDLKPGNVLLDANGQPLLTDFGLARRSSESELTRTGAILGTPEYMPPEQARGETATTASDIYSLGAILYRLLTGRTPHVGDSSLAVMRSIATDPVPKPRELVKDLDRDLEAIVLKCLASDPADRYASAADLTQDLRAHRDGLPLIARPAGPVELIRIWIRQQFGNVRWVPVIALVIGGTSGFLMWSLGTEANMEIEPALVEQIRPADRAPLWWLRLPIPAPIMGTFLLCLTVMIGLPIKVLVKPKTRAADAIAGFGVGLLIGIVCYIAGLGALLNAAGIGTFGQDFDLLVIGSQNPSFAEISASRRYPELGDLPWRHQVRVLETRINSHFRTIPLLVGWIGAPLTALAFAVAGMVQTVVLGDMTRRRLAHRSVDPTDDVVPTATTKTVIDRYYVAGVFEYTFFALLLAQFLFFVTAIGSQWILTGASSFVDWTNELIAAALVVAGLIAVAMHWRLWLRVPMLIVACIAGGWLSGRVSHDVSHRWQVAVKQGNVAKFARAAAIHDDPLTQLRLAEAKRQLAFRYLTGHRDRAISLLQSGLGVAESTPPEGKWKNVREQTIVDTRFGLAQALLTDGEIDEAAKALLPIRGSWGDQADEHANGFAIFVGNVLRSAAASVSDDADQRTRWTRRTVDRLVPQLWSDSRLAHRYADWLTSQQVWRLYGPIELPPGAPRDATSSSKLLAMTPPIEKKLISLSGDDDLPPAAATIATASDQPVHLGEFLNPNRNVLAYAVSQIHSDTDQTVTFRLGSDDGATMWVDGRRVHHNDANRGMRRADDRFDVQLSSGLHLIVLKISQGTEDWGFVIDAVDQGDPENDWDGRPVALWRRDVE